MDIFLFNNVWTKNSTLQKGEDCWRCGILNTPLRISVWSTTLENRGSNLFQYWVKGYILFLVADNFMNPIYKGLPCWAQPLWIWMCICVFNHIFFSYLFIFFFNRVELLKSWKFFFKVNDTQLFVESASANFNSWATKNRWSDVYNRDCLTMVEEINLKDLCFQDDLFPPDFGFCWTFPYRR